MDGTFDEFSSDRRWNQFQPPGGRLGAISFSLSFTWLMTFKAFSPWRMINDTPNRYSLPVKSVTPRRMSGPRDTRATSLTRSGVPSGHWLHKRPFNVFRGPI